MSFLWWGVGVFAFLYLVNLLMVVRVLLQIDLQLPRRTRIDAEEIPAYLRPCFDELHSELEHLGFEHRDYLSCTAIGRTAGPPIHGSLLLHSATGAYAELDTQTMSECTPFGITFHSQLKSGRRLITLNGTSWGVIGEMPNTDLADAWAATLALHWSAHQKEVEKRGGAVAVEVDAFLSSADAEERAMVEGLLGTGRAVPTRERGIARLGIWTALRAALPVRRGMARKLALDRARAGAAPCSPIPIDCETDTYLRAQEVLHRNVGRDAKLWLLVVSLALAAFTFSNLGDSSMVALVLAALSLHELGHLAAMRAFGYRDTAIFFIPFFGAAATGSKSAATVEQRSIVALMGPLPGLLLGAALLGWAPSGASTMSKAGYVFLSLNLINLLPMLPLDGGHLASYLVFSRHPRLELVFRLFAIAVFGAAAVLTSQPVFAVLAFFGVLTLRSAWHRSLLRRALLRNPAAGVLPDREQARSALAWMREHLAKISAPKRHAIVRAVCNNELHQPARLAPTLLLGAAYLATVALGIAVVARQPRAAGEDRAATCEVEEAEETGPSPSP